jgi:hypothetical protein
VYSTSWRLTSCNPSSMVLFRAMAWLQQRVKRCFACRSVAFCWELVAGVLNMLHERWRKLRGDDDMGEVEVDGESIRPPVKERCKYLTELHINSLWWKDIFKLHIQTRSTNMGIQFIWYGLALPVRSKSQNWLSYPGSRQCLYFVKYSAYSKMVQIKVMYLKKIHILCPVQILCK